MNTPGFLKRNILTCAILMAPFLFLAVEWKSFPARVPIHWNVYGRPDGWAGKGTGLLLMPALAVLSALLLTWLPRLDPKLRRNPEYAERMLTVVAILRLAMTAFLSFVSILIAVAALGHTFNMTRMAMDAALILFVVIGNFFSKMKPNYFIGIRTPWTLESPEVWRATHRLGGRIFVFGGLGLLLLQFVLTPVQLAIALAAFVLLTTVWTFVYSYRLSRSLSAHAP
jgi:uncharacterized membrane protein